MYCWCYCANGEAYSCASSGCGSAIHETAFTLTGFLLLKNSLIYFFSSQRNVSIGKVQFWYIPLFNFLVIRALSSFYCFFRTFWINAIWVATISDDFLFLLKVEATYLCGETICIFMALKISLFPRWIY